MSFATFPIEDIKGKKITINFNSFNFSDKLPEEGIYITANLKGVVYEKYYSIGYTDNIPLLIETNQSMFLQKGANRTLVYQIENNDLCWHIIEQIEKSKGV